VPRQFTRGRGRLGSKRMTSWLEIPPVLSGPGVTLLASLSALELAKRPFTVVRTHLAFRLRSDQIVANETYIGAVGLAVVSDQASAIGITAIPTPVVDADSDLWFVHQWNTGTFFFGSSTSFVDSAGTQILIDSKAMRKVNEDEDVVVVFERDTVVSDGCLVQLAGRMLIKEH